jgi:NADPH:quinone reductase-like Zn-dependent oxidoreductase
MDAIVYRKFGGPEVLELVELPEPKVGQGSVLVQVKAAALNPADIGMQAGAADGIIDARFPVTPGWDVAGVVQAVGAGVTEFRPGDEVIGFVYEGILRHGTYAERIAAAAHYFARNRGTPRGRRRPVFPWRASPRTSRWCGTSSCRRVKR